ncbi:MAG: hypothetical protein U0271_06920 [Polyangiaceae bacterium]
MTRTIRYARRALEFALVASLSIAGCASGQTSSEAERPKASASASSKPVASLSGTANASAPRFTLLLPGNRVAKIPIEVVEQYIDPRGTAVHDPNKVNLKHEDEEGQWHTDYEYGDCLCTTSNGPKQMQTWHRHPLGTEYAEAYE